MLNVSDLLYYSMLYLTGTLGVLFFFLHCREMQKPILYSLIYLASLVLNWLIIQNVGPVSLINSILFLGITVIMVYHPWSIKHGILIFYITAALIIFNIITSDSRRILINSSNYISVLLVLACSFYYIALENHVGRIRLIDLIPAGLCFFISVWAEGRGGIITCAFLLIMLLVLYMRTAYDSKIKRTILFVVILILAMVILYIMNYDLVEVFLGLGKFESRGFHIGDRMYIWGSYISKARESVFYFLFGAPLEQIPVVAMFNGNTHNSFLQLHAFCGLITLVITIFLILKSLYFYIKSRQYIIAIMMLTVVLRGLSDKFIFGQYGMPIMLFFIWLPFFQRNHNNTMNK